MTGIGIACVGDARALQLPDECVDLIVTSPPYFALRDYKDGDKSVEGQVGAEATPDEFLEALWACSAEWWRVLKPGGSLWLNLGDKYNSAQSGHQSGSLEGGDAAKRTTGRGKSVSSQRPKSLLGLPWRYAIGMTDGKGDPDGKGWVLRAEIVWAKPNGLPESVRDRVARKHEQWFHFTKSERSFSAVDLIREPYAAPTATRTAGARGSIQGSTPGIQNAQDSMNPLGKMPGSVWTVATEPLKVPAELGIDHFAAFPTEFPRRIILGWAPTRGICNTCGEGLRPIKSKPGARGIERDYKPHLGGRATPPQWKGGANPNPRVITGWECACDKPSNTTPAIILDPFGGTGTTAAVAKALNCIGISIDLSTDYTRLAKWRIDGDGYNKITKKVNDRTRRQP